MKAGSVYAMYRTVEDSLFIYDEIVVCLEEHVFLDAGGRVFYSPAWTNYLELKLGARDERIEQL